MCTATTYTTKDHYFGRNLDLEFSYHEEVTIAAREFPFRFRHVPDVERHYGIIGMAYVLEDYPLFYDATNEEGLSMAGLNFPGNAHYCEQKAGKDNVASFEFIPWILSQCETVAQAEDKISGMNMLAEGFAAELPPQPLHWMISDMERSIVVEAVKEGIRVYDNPVGTMTNNPTFDHQLYRLNDYRNITPGIRESDFAEGMSMDEYSRGMGGMGLPGDLSSASRFVKAVFTRMNSISDESEEASVSQFFHILGSVEQQRGCCRLGEGKNEITIYSSCCNMEKGIYYYKTYDNSQITAVNMHKEDLDSNKLIRFPLVKEMQIRYEN